jgi:hypothetical protein
MDLLLDDGDDVAGAAAARGRQGFLHRQVAEPYHETGFADAGEQAAQQLVWPGDLDGVAQWRRCQAVGRGEQQQRGQRLTATQLFYRLVPPA